MRSLVTDFVDHRISPAVGMNGRGLDAVEWVTLVFVRLQLLIFGEEVDEIEVFDAVASLEERV